MTNTTGGVDSRVSNAIADYIADIPDTMSVEQIQDIVIDQLKNSPLSDVADAYSRWRILGSFFYERSAGGAANMNGFIAIAIPMLCCLLGSLLMGLLSPVRTGRCELLQTSGKIFI